MRAAKPSEVAEIRKSTELSAGGNISELAPAIDASRLAEMSDGQASADNLGTLVRRVSESSSQQIENLVGELQSLRKKLHSDGNRIQSEIEEYAVLSQQVMQLTTIIPESMSKLPANGGGLRSAIARPEPQENCASTCGPWRRGPLFYLS